MWASEARARALYRGMKRSRESSDQLDEALELLGEQSHAPLARRKAQFVKGPLTWAKLADLCIDILTRELADATAETVDDIYERAQQLHSRLEGRDAVKGARITRENRDGILRVYGAARSLHQLVRLKSGDLKPSFELASQLTRFRQQWHRLALEVTPAVLSLVQEAVAKVLTTGTDGERVAFSRLLAYWVPPERTEERGEKVEFDDDDF
jgi:hypothetical protein|eukprot:7391913-Prymnesium_polylepis.2